MSRIVEAVGRSPLGRAAFWLLLTGLALATAVVATIGFVPRDALIVLLGALSPDGSIENLEAIVGRARWLSAVLVLLVALSWSRQMSLIRWMDEALIESVRLSVVTARSGWRALVRRDPVAWALLAIVVVGTLLRGAHLAEPVEYDEAWTVLEFVAQPLPIGVSSQREANNHVFHTLVARPFFLAGGYRMWAIRIPVFVAGVLLIPMTFLLGRAMGGVAVGLWSSVLTVAAGPVLLYSFRARGYAFVALAFVVLLVLGYRQLRTPGKAVWLAFMVTASLGAFTTPAMFYPFLAVVCWLFLASWNRPRQERRRFHLDLAGVCVGTGLLTFLLYTPLLLASGPGRLLRPPFAAPVSSAAFLVFYGSAEPWVALGRYLSDPLPVVAAVGLATVAVLGCFKWVHGGPEPAPMIGLLAIPVAVFLHRVLPPERVFTFVVPLLAATACVGLAGTLGALPAGKAGRLRAHAWAAPAAAVLLAAYVQWRSDFFPRARYLAGYDDPGAVTACLSERLGPDDALLVKGVVLWPTRYLLAKRGMPAAWLTAHRREDFSGRLWAISVHAPLETAVQEELADGRTRRELMAYSRPVSSCGNATLHEMASTPAGEGWASTPAAQPESVAP